MIDVPSSPKDWYRASCDRSGFVCDAIQLAAMEELQTLWLQLVEFKARRNGFLGRCLLSPEVPKGLYIWGGWGAARRF